MDLREVRKDDVSNFICFPESWNNYRHSSSSILDRLTMSSIQSDTKHINEIHHVVNVNYFHIHISMIFGFNFEANH